MTAMERLQRLWAELSWIWSTNSKEETIDMAIGLAFLIGFLLLAWLLRKEFKGFFKSCFKLGSRILIGYLMYSYCPALLVAGVILAIIHSVCSKKVTLTIVTILGAIAGLALAIWTSFGV